MSCAGSGGETAMSSALFGVAGGTIAATGIARAVSWVLAGGLAAGIIGPQTVIWTSELIPGALFAASFLAQAVLALLTIVAVSFLKPAPAAPDASKSGGRPLSEIVRQPRFLVAVAAGVVSFASITFLMTAAPLAMVECGHSVGTAALGIQWHVLAMFGPSFFTPRLFDRFGKERVTAAGLLLIGAAARERAFRPFRRQFLAGARPSRRRLELRLHGRDGARDRVLPRRGAGEGAGGE